VTAAAPASAGQPGAQAADLVGELRLAGTGAVNDGGRCPLHERGIRQTLAGGGQPAFGLGEVALQPFAFEFNGLVVDGADPYRRLDLAARDDDAQVAGLRRSCEPGGGSDLGRRAALGEAPCPWRR